MAALQQKRLFDVDVLHGHAEERVLGLVENRESGGSDRVNIIAGYGCRADRASPRDRAARVSQRVTDEAATVQTVMSVGRGISSYQMFWVLTPGLIAPMLNASAFCEGVRPICERVGESVRDYYPARAEPEPTAALSRKCA